MKNKNFWSKKNLQIASNIYFKNTSISKCLSLSLPRFGLQCKMIDFSRQDTVIRDHFRSDIRIKYFVWGFKASLQPTGRRVAEQTQILMIYFS